MPIVRITLPAEKRALREKMRALGLGHREIAAEFARRYRPRPRAVADPDDAERKAIIGITGVHQSAGTKRLTVSLAALDAAVPGGPATGWCRF